MERAPFLCEDGAVTSLHIPSDEPDLKDGLIQPDELEATDAFSLPPQPPRPASGALPTAERQRIQRALDLCAGNQTRAALVLGFSRRTLVNRLGQLSLPRPKKV